MTAASAEGARRHAVIGDGLAAMEFAATAPLSAGDRLTIIGPNIARLGRGLAYKDHPTDRPWRDAWLLNSPAEIIEQDFVDWTAERWRSVAQRMRGRTPDWLGFGAEAIAARDFGALFLPRALYGDYLVEYADSALAAHNRRGVRVERIASSAGAIDATDAGFRIALASGDRREADSIDIATGGPPNQSLSETTPGVFPALYDHEDAIAEAIGAGAPVLCIGSNAAMLDLMRFMQSFLEEPAIDLMVISANGRLPEPLIHRRPRRAPVTPALKGPYPDADAFLRDLDAEIAGLRAEGAEMAQLRQGYRIWVERVGLSALTPDAGERRRIPALLERRFLRGTHDSITDFHRLRDAGRIRMTLGKAVSVRPAAQGGVVEVRSPNDSMKRYEAPVIVNCAGPGPANALEPLAESLVERGWLTRDAASGGVIVGPGLEAARPGLRYLSPAVIEIGGETQAFPIYIASRLRKLAQDANKVGFGGGKNRPAP